MQTDMSLATREDRKTVTRRITGKELHHINQNPDEWEYKSGSAFTQNRLWDSNKEPNPNPLKIGWKFTNKVTGEELTVWSPYGCPGDWLWVREAWSEVGNLVCGEGAGNSLAIGFRAGHIAYTRNKLILLNTDGVNWDHVNWKPSIHMFKKDCRTWLENVSIRPERLHDITEEDAKREGVLFLGTHIRTGASKWKHYGALGELGFSCKFARLSFYTLWDSINGKAKTDKPAYPSDLNPWVLRVEYKVLSKEGRPV